MKQVKICGITGEQEIEWLNEYKPDFAGFVLFFPKSRRNIELEKAAELIRLLSPDIRDGGRYGKTYGRAGKSHQRSGL